ncbi:MAG: alginate lyase family protein [Clostridia bacterium]|nr:alginate lyase family protein [Clostridia bacterium]
MSYIFTSEERINEIKQQIILDKRLKRELIELAEEYRSLDPLSVTFHKSPAESGNPHDFFSEATYWWPDEANPDGPYIKRDGETNPNRFTHHLNDLNTLSKAVCALAQAGLYLENYTYYKKAVELIKVWFLDKETKMNPHLEYAQAIRGVCNGRFIGIIDTHWLIALVAGANIIEMSGLFSEEIAGLKEWFKDYTHWLNTSEKGIEEKNYFNNHSNWWNSQVATYCAFTGNDTLLTECFEKFKNDILANQIDDKGIFVDEITRTMSYTYTIFNMTACTITCELAYHKGVDLWNASSPNGHSFKQCVEFFKPYYNNPFLWNFPQINAGESNLEIMPMKLAAVRYRDKKLDAINIKKRVHHIPCQRITHLGIIDLL